MSTVSGWCSAPTGARPKHAHCRAEVCGCFCHRGEMRKPPFHKGSEGSAGVDLGHNSNGPERGVCTSGRGLADASKGVD